MRFRLRQKTKTKTQPMPEQENTAMPDINSIAAQVDALSNLVTNLTSERDALRAQNADLATQLANAQAAAVDPTVLNSISDRLAATITSLTPAPQ